MEKTMRLELNMIGEAVEDFKKSMELQIGDALQLKDGRFAKVVDSGVWEYDEELEEEIHRNIKFIEIINEEEYNAIKSSIENEKKVEEESKQQLKNLISEKRTYLYDNSDVEPFTEESVQEYRKSETIASNSIGTFYKVGDTIKLMVIAGYDTIIRKINLDEEEIISICNQIK